MPNLVLGHYVNVLFLIKLLHVSRLTYISTTAKGKLTD